MDRAAGRALMARPSPTVSGAIAILDGAEEPATSPLSSRTLRRLAAAVGAARTEILAAVAAEGAGVVAERLGVDAATLRRWRAPGGWLRATQEPAQGGG